MENDLDEILHMVKPWVLQEDLYLQCMEESSELGLAKKIVEDNVLKAIFDFDEDRVTLYDGTRCFCMFYDSFLSYVETHKVVHESDCSKADMLPKVIDKKKKDKNCSVS